MAEVLAGAVVEQTAEAAGVEEQTFEVELQIAEVGAQTAAVAAEVQTSEVVKQTAAAVACLPVTAG